MSTEKKAEIKQAKLGTLLRGARVLLTTSTPTAGLPPGIRVETNAAAVTRFPLPLTIGSAVIAAIGIFAFMRGHRVLGAAMALGGGVGLGASAAAPEIMGALK